MKSLFEHAKSLIVHADTIIDKANVHIDNAREQIVAGLFNKILNGANAIILLCEKGYSVEAEIIVRSVLEAFFYMGACINSEDAIKNFLGKPLLEKIRAIGMAKRDPDAFNTEIREYLLSIADNVKSQISEQNIMNLSAMKASKLANAYDLYIVYMIQSDAIHSNPQHLQDTYMVHDENCIQQINIGPNPLKTEDALTALNIVLAMSCKLYRQLFKLAGESEVEKIERIYTH